MNLPINYQNTFDPSKNYVKSLHFPGQGISAEELNSDADMMDYKRIKLANVILKEGDIVSGGSPVVRLDGNVTIPSGSVYVNNDIREYDEQSFTIPTDSKLKLGVYLEQVVVSAGDNPGLGVDPDLKDPSGQIPGGRTYKTSGLETRKTLQENITWGYVEDDGTRSQVAGTFYPVVDVDNAILILVGSTPVLSEVENLVVNYYINVNGSYIIEGFDTFFDYDDTENDEYVYTVEPGLAAVLGRQLSRSASDRLAFTKDPDTVTITNDPDDVTVETLTYTATLTKGVAGSSEDLGRPTVTSIISVTDGTTTYTSGDDYNLSGNSIDWTGAVAEPAEGAEYSVTFEFTGALITVDRGPINQVTSVSTQLEVTKQLTRGIIADGSDPLPVGFIPATAVLNIPGYTQGVDYRLDNSNIVWDVGGGSEPTSGSTYDVTYLYTKDISPDEGSIGYNTFTITDQGADGTLGDTDPDQQCFVTYDYSLNRIDIIELNNLGELRRIKGVSRSSNPNQPKPSPDSIGIAAIFLDFFNDPAVKLIGNKRINQEEQFKIKSAQVYILDTLADLSLKIDSIQEGASTNGIFVDTFVDRDKEDSGKTNNLLTFNQLVTLPVTLTKDELEEVNENNKAFQSLDFTLEDIVVQGQSTSTIRINPYATYTPPEPVRLDIRLTQEVKDYVNSLIVNARNPAPSSWMPTPSLPPVVTVPSNQPIQGDLPISIPDPDPRSAIDIARDAALAVKGKTKLGNKAERKLQRAFIRSAQSGSSVVQVRLGKHQTNINTSTNRVRVRRAKG